jgi:hypothetical protein
LSRHCCSSQRCTSSYARRIIGARDIDFSFDTQYPDYIRTGAVADLRAQLSNAWDADLRIEGERMVHEPAPGFTATSYADQYGLRLPRHPGHGRGCAAAVSHEPWATHRVRPTNLF